MVMFSSVSLSAQSFGHDHAKCGTVSNELSIERVKENKKRAASSDFRMETIYLPIKFHRVGTNDGSDQIKISSILDQMCRLTREYKKYDIVPYIYEGFNDVFNTGIYLNPLANNSQMISRKDGNAVDIFVTENADVGSEGGGGLTLGYYVTPGVSENDYIVLRKKELIDSTGTIEHELGHYLSLLHTFNGWETVPFDLNIHGNPVSISSVGGVPVELVDRNSNCENAGDLLCDTETDHNFNFLGQGSPAITAGCNMIVELRDKEDNLIEPPFNNTMSYYSCTDGIFSEGQIELMNADYNSPFRNHIRNSYIPNLNEITEAPTLLTPSSDAEIYNSVQFNWTAVEHADFYVLEITSSSEAFSYITTQPNKLVTDLSPDKNYFWQVSPFNETSTCIRSSNKVVSTGNVFSSVESLNDVAQIMIYPNPVDLGASLQISIDSKEAFNADISILGLDGKEVLVQNNKKINTNNNILEIPTENIASGMYFLQIRSQRGVFSKQIVIK